VLAWLIGLPLLSLLVLREPSYDATAWLIWGRPISHGTLETLGGPSWKPLPVLFTTVFAPTGDTVAPMLWLLVARAGALAALLAAFAVARRLAGSATAGLLAAGALALASDFLYNAARGDSEGLLVAAVLGAVLLHSHDRRTAAFLLGAVAALLRPEVWPLWGAYGAFVLHNERRLRTPLLMIFCGAAVLAAWFIPEKIGSGDFLRAASRAQNPVPGSPGTSSFPFLMTFLNGAVMLSIPVYAGALRAVISAWRSRNRAVLAVAGGAAVLMTTVALLAENGFTGNLRYVTLPASLLCVLAGIGLPELAADLQHRGVRRSAAVVAGVSVLVGVGVLGWGGYRLLRDEGRYGRQLPALIERVGGERAIKACRPVAASPFQRQAVAWRLHLRQRQVTTRPQGSGTALAFRDTRIGRDARMPVRADTDRWVLRSSCPGLRPVG
jgi:hypothetical protein